MGFSISIKEMLAETLYEPGNVLSDVEIGDYMRRHFLGTDATTEKSRRERHRRRQDIYNDGALPYVIKLIDAVFQDVRVRELRKQWAEAAQFNNVCKRIVNEASTVYSEPAQRRVGGDNAGYVRLLKRCKQDRRFRHAGRMLNLHRTVLLGFRVRNEGTKAKSRMVPVIDVVTPDNAFIVAHPNDQGVPIAVGIKIDTKYARSAAVAPAWVLWTEYERLHLTEGGDVVPGSTVPHGFQDADGNGVLPFVVVTLDEQTSSCWPGTAGEDLVAASLAIAFSNTCLLKETKSSNKQQVLTGDMTRTARMQAADSEVPIELADGGAVSTVDGSMDLDPFMAVGNHVQDTVGNNYGLSSDVMRGASVASADARDLQRIPLRELRLEQHVVWRDAEQRFAVVQAAVIDAEAKGGVPDLADLRFDPTGFLVDFADPQTPRSGKEKLEEFEHARRLTIDSTVAYIQRLNPDLTKEEAWGHIATVIDDELERNKLLRPLQRISGSPGADMPADGATPEQGVNEPSEEPGTAPTSDLAWVEEVLSGSA